MEKEKVETETKAKKTKKVKKNEEVTSLIESLALEKEKNLRVQAELLNYKRRKEEEVSCFLKYASEDVIKSLLPVIDNFERAIRLDDNDLTDEISKFLAGFKMIYGNFIEVLNKNEVKEIEAEGLEFDPNFHQAVITEKDENKPEGVVLEVLQKGYLYKDRVIRPAMVKVNE
ncbi:MAG: nucleotide exchange factor GrpE [Bacilli bacterium]|nr:nucleotide exchange factor GrpE [Bacilli bacterium]